MVAHHCFLLNMEMHPLMISKAAKGICFLQPHISEHASLCAFYSLLLLLLSPCAATTSRNRTLKLAPLLLCKAYCYIALIVAPSPCPRLWCATVCFGYML